MANIWAILSENQMELIEQHKLPVLQNRGKDASLFPLYIQCRSLEDAEEVEKIFRPLLKLYATSSSGKQLACTIYRSLNCSAIMSDVDTWYVLLNGRSFRGILHSASDFDSQTRDFQYSSWRKAESFEDALLIMVLKGEKNLLPEIKAPSPSASSVTTDLDHLSVSSLSVEDDDDLRMSPPTSACGVKSTQFSNTHPDQPGPSLKSPVSPPTAHTFKFKPQPMFASYTQWPRSTAFLPGNGFSVKPVYKYIRNIAGTVGTINDRSGVLSHITAEDHLILGDVRATYLDSHGYGTAEVVKIVSAFDSADIQEFIARAEGCGMSIVELEWFWTLD